MNTPSAGRYKVVGYRYDQATRHYVEWNVRHFDSKGSAQIAAREALSDTKVYPDLIDTKTGEYLA